MRAKAKEAAKNLKTNPQEPLHIYGPIGHQVMTDHILTTCAEDIRERLDELLILYHQLFHGVSEAELLLEVQVGNKRYVVSSKDWEVY